MNDFLNPYIAGAPVVEPSMFFGRQDIFDWIEQNLSGRFVNHILVIHGQRRVGKTSVLKQIPNHLPSNFINVFFDLQGRTHTSLDRFQWWLAREICRAVNQRSVESIPVPEHELFVQDGEYLAATFLPELLSKLGQSILLLTFDEFDTLSEPEIQQSLTKPLIAYLRRLFDLPNLNFIFSIGSSGHKLENMQASYTEFFKTALYRKISFLKQEDCAHLITRPVEGVLTYEPSAVERVYTITSGHPYFTQLICHELFSLSQKTGRRTLTREDVESVLEDVIERGTVNLKFVWDEASDLEKWVLSSLAHELQAQRLEQPAQGIYHQPVCTDKQLASALHNQHVRFSENDLNTALVHLREKDVLTQDNRFVVELLCIWLLKNRPLDRVREELVQVNPIANRYNEIGDEFRSLGQPDKAMESFKQALATDPSNLRAQVSIANLHLEGGNYDQAMQGYEAALRIDDDDITARSGLSTVLMALGEAATTAGIFKEAEGYYQHILTINPDHPEVHMHLATLYTHQAEEALSAGKAEGALGYFQRALEYSPEDSQLAERYDQVKAEHTRRLIAELLEQSKQAEEKQDWDVALDTVQRALQLAPNEPALLNRLATIKETSRLAQISSLRLHAQEMEGLEHWEEAIHDWEGCLTLHPEDEAAVQKSLERAQRMLKISGDYILAQSAIKEGRYSQAIPLLQGVIAQDATYKDAAKLLVDCLKRRPQQMLKLPARWMRWTLLIVLLIAAIVGIATQWSHLSPLIAGIGQSKTPVVTYGAGSTPPAILPAGDIPPATLTAAEIPPPTATAMSQEMQSFTWWVEKLTGGRAPDFQDDFSSATLQEYWANDGAHAGTLDEGTLRLENGTLIGDSTLISMNYILHVDLRFTGVSSDEAFIYEFRLTPIAGKSAICYTFKIEPSNGNYSLVVNTDPNGQFTQINGGNLGSLQDGRWYELGIIVNEQTIGVYLDDKQILTHDKVELFGLINDFGSMTSHADATLEIDNWRLWELETPSYMRNDWISAHPTTVEDDNFIQGQGWKFNPVENESYQDGKVELLTNGGDTYLSRDDLQGTNVAMEVTFIPRDMPDSATLIWFLGKDNTTGDHFAFEYSPSSGVWSIIEGKNKDWNKLVTGVTHPTPVDTAGTIMFVVDGDRVFAFYGDSFLNSVIMSHGSPGDTNSLGIRDNSSQFAQVDITKIRFWDLDTVEWLGTDWITARPETVLIDSFTGNEGLSFYPQENEIYVDGKAVLFTKAGETSLSREDLQGKNIALEGSFLPQTMTNTAALVLVLGEDPTTLDCVEFSYFSNTGEWQINKVVNRQWELLSSGMTQSNPSESGVTIMAVTYSDHVDVYLNQNYLGSAKVDRSGAGSRNELVLRSKENQYARADIYLIRSWNLPVDEPASGEGTASLSETINSLTDGRPPDFQDDFSSATLQEYWSSDQGAQEGTLQDGALRLKNENLIGQDTLNKMNYILQVDLRFGGISPDENFFYGIRTTEFQNGKYGSEYLLNINPSNGEWAMNVITDPHGQWTGIQKGNLGLIEAGRWYELGIVVNTDSIQTFWDDQLFLTQDSVVLYGLVNHFGLDPSRAVESATVDIDNWRFWELETPPYMQNDWISETTPTVQEDNFIADEGWQFSPPENEKYQDGAAVLYTNGGETGLTREDIHGTNFAMDVTFSPRDMPDTASLVWFLRKDTSTSESLEFEYFPATGFWKIRRTENKNNLELASGWNQPTDQDKKGTIMVLVDGDRVSAFLGDAFLGYAESSNPVAGTWNELVIRSGEAAHAEMDISSIRFWDLNTLKWSNYDLLTSGEPTFVDDNFTKGEGWIFDPAEMEKYEGGNAILTTNGGKSTPTTALTRTGLQGVKLALEVTFIPRTLSDTARLLWVLKVNYTSWCEISLTYFPTTGVWEFGRFNYHAPEALGNGSTQTVPVGSSARIMVATDGEHISAFYNGAFFGTATTTSSCFGALNQIGLADEGEAFSQVDITKITFWKLDD